MHNMLITTHCTLHRCWRRDKKWQWQWHTHRRWIRHVLDVWPSGHEWSWPFKKKNIGNLDMCCALSAQESLRKHCEKMACRDVCRVQKLWKKKGCDKFRITSWRQIWNKQDKLHLKLLSLSSSSVCLCALSSCCCCVLLSLVVVCVRCVCVWDIGKTTVRTFKTPPWVPAPRPHDETHVRVVQANTGTFWIYTWRRF